MNSKGFDELEGFNNAKSKVRPRRIIYITIYEELEFRCYYYLLKKNRLIMKLTT